MTFCGIPSLHKHTVIAQAHYFQAPFLLKKTIETLIKSFEEAIFNIMCDFYAVSEQILKLMLFSQNFQIRELEDQLSTNKKMNFLFRATIF